MLVPPVNARLGTTPWVLAKGSFGFTSGALALEVMPSGVAWMALWEKLKAKSFSMPSRMELIAWTAIERPGELVFVIAPLGMEEPVKRPPASVVGIVSIPKRPQIWNFSP